MKTFTFVKVLLFLIAIISFVSCKKNQPPTCQFEEPSDGYTLAKGIILSISISAEDPDGVIVDAMLSIDDIGLTNLEFPYTYDLNTGDYNRGPHTLKVTVLDDEGLQTSDEIVINIDPPLAITGESSILRYNSVNLSGEVSDNGGPELTQSGFYYGNTPDPAGTGNRVLITAESGIISTTLFDLTLGETIYYQAFAVNSDGESPGEEKSVNPSAVEIGTFTDPRDQQEYGSVKIGEQVWMSENLKATTLNNGTEIPLLADSATWSTNTGAAYCWQNNDPELADMGALYSWYTVETGKLCPSGWHVPTDLEWRQFEYFIGMDESVALTDGYRGSNQGGMLKTTTLWQSPNTGAIDAFQFSAKPSGRRGFAGEFAT